MSIFKKHKNNNIVYGVILDVDVGYGLKYKDEDNIYLKLVIQQFDNFECTQLFRINRLSELLDEFCGHYSNISTVNELLHQRVCLNAGDNHDGIPNAIAKNNPATDKNSQWIFNDNWN